MHNQINILTRCSRPYEVGFGRTLTSVKEQTIDFNWFISYETQEVYEYLKSQDLPANTTLVKVPKYQHIPNLGIARLSIVMFTLITIIGIGINGMLLLIWGKCLKLKLLKGKK